MKTQDSKTFNLRLTQEERKKLKLMAVQQGTSVTSIIRNLLANNKLIEEACK